MKIILTVLVLLVYFGSMAYAEKFFIEDPSLKPVPQNAVKTILANEKDPDLKKCEFIGKPMNLSKTGEEKSQVLIVTTDHGCGCGNGLCTIWLLQPKGDLYSVLLSDGGYSMTIVKQNNRKTPDIKFEASTAGWLQESLWKFDGKRYKRMKLETR